MAIDRAGMVNGSEWIEGIGEMTAPINPTLHRVNRFIESLGTLSPEGEVRAQLCRGLAERIDRSRESKTGAASMAATQLARQLESSIEGLKEACPDDDGFLGDLLNGSGDE